MNGGTKPLGTWRTIRLGTGLKTAEEFHHALNDGGFRVGSWVLDALRNPAFTVATEETEVALIRVTVAGLGFEKGAQRGQIYERAKELGLKLCPPEVGPQLRLQYRNQPNGESVFVAMDSIIISGGGPNLFVVESELARGESESWLHSIWSEVSRFCCADSLWVFCK